MEIRNVKTFIKVAEMGSFSNAARYLGYAQSTVTMHIRALEEELNVPLFERNGKHVRLSTAGREFLDFAYVMESSEAAAIEHFSSTSEPEGPLRIGVMETMCDSIYARIFTDYCRRYPRVQQKISVMKTLDCMDSLEHGLVDIILTVDKRIVRQEWVTDYIQPARISFFCSPAHPFAGRADVTLEELSKESMIQIEQGCNYREEFEHYAADQGYRMNNVMEIGYTRVIINGVAENQGVSLLPLYSLKKPLERGRISLFGVKDYSSSMWIQMIHVRNHWITPAMRAFLDFAGEVLQNTCQ